MIRQIFNEFMQTIPNCHVNICEIYLFWENIFVNNKIDKTCERLRKQRNKLKRAKVHVTSSVYEIYYAIETRHQKSYKVKQKNKRGI